MSKHPSPDQFATAMGKVLGLNNLPKAAASPSLRLRANLTRFHHNPHLHRRPPHKPAPAPESAAPPSEQDSHSSSNPLQKDREEAAQWLMEAIHQSLRHPQANQLAFVIHSQVLEESSVIPAEVLPEVLTRSMHLWRQRLMMLRQ